MRSFKVLTQSVAKRAGVTWVLSAALGLSVLSMTACSSPEEDAEARGDNVEISTTSQDQVELEAQTPKQDNVAMADTESSNIESVDTESSNIENSNIESIDTSEGVASSEESVVIDEGDTVGNEQLGTHDNDDIADGTDEEENVSTY